MRLNYAIARYVAALLVCVLPNRAYAQARTIAKGVWYQVSRIDEQHGFSFIHPAQLAVSGNAILVYDDARHILTSFDRDGHVRWETGRTAEGLSRFELPTGLAGDDSGGAMMIDKGGLRITTINANGTFEDRRFTESPVRRVAYLSDRRLVVAPSFLAMAAILGTHGELQHAAKLPSVKGNRVVSAPAVLPDDSGGVIVAFQYGTLVKRLDSRLKSVSQFELIDPRPFPVLQKYRPYPGRTVTATRVDPAAPTIVRSITLHRDTLFVVDDRTMESQPMLDLYNVRTGAYLESRLLPEPVRLIRVHGDLLVGMLQEPMPAIVFWRWEPRPQ